MASRRRNKPLKGAIEQVAARFAHDATSQFLKGQAKPPLQGVFDVIKKVGVTWLASTIFEWVEKTPGSRVVISHVEGRVQVDFTKDGKVVEGPLEE